MIVLGPHHRPTYLAVVGDANDPITWSGIPYHFLLAARERGLIDEGLNLSLKGRAWAVRRALWNALAVAKGRHLGGYQYQPCFLEQLYAPVQQQLLDGVVLNFFQMFPPSIVAERRIEKHFYIDMTLRQLFENYGATIDDRTAAEAMEREREGYEAAALVITHSRWAAQSVIRDYGIAAARVHTVVPGANLDPLVYAEWARKHRGTANVLAGRPLKFVFVGRKWKRKGLDRLLAAFAAARRQGSSATLRIIGFERGWAPAEYRDIEGVEWFGLIDKRRHAARFLESIAECDVGCLLSRAEAGGIALREFHALGLVVIGPAVNGAPEHMIPGASISIPVTASDRDIADVMHDLCHDRSRFQRMREIALHSRRNALWDTAVESILHFWPHAVDQ